MSGISIKKDNAPVAAKPGRVKLFPNENGKYGQIDENGNIEEFAIKGENPEVPQDINELTDNDTLLKFENLVYDDWFLPSSKELQKIYLNLYENGIGNLIDTYYWSSTEDEEDAITLNFLTGALEIASKNAKLNIRPVRSFSSREIYELGDIGPAGGYIFYIDDSDPLTRTYFEAAKEDTAKESWSNVLVAIGTTSSDIGSGYDNCEQIISQEGHLLSAANQCMSIANKTDQIIPKEEKKINERDIKTKVKRYKALLKQVGTNPPVPIVLENTLDEIPVFAYEDEGVYIMTLENYNARKTAIFSGDGNLWINRVNFESDGILYLVMTGGDSKMFYVPIVIEVYE